MITTLFFDLDGTLLPMDLERFTRAYLKSLGEAMALHGFDPQILAGNILKSIRVMSRHDPAQTNEQAFWAFFASIYGPQILDQMPVFDDYYHTAFEICQKACPQNPDIPRLIETARRLGFRIVLATNPIFPRMAVEKRIAWAGLKAEDFEWITTYENSHYAKPDPAYFLETARALGIDPQNVLMIGNDLNEDYGAIDAGMQLYILTDCLIPSDTHRLDDVPHGTVRDLEHWLQALKERQDAQNSQN